MDAYAKCFLIQMQVPNKQETTSPGFQIIIIIQTLIV